MSESPIINAAAPRRAHAAISICARLVKNALEHGINNTNNDIIISINIIAMSLRAHGHTIVECT